MSSIASVIFASSAVELDMALIRWDHITLRSAASASWKLGVALAGYLGPRS